MTLEQLRILVNVVQAGRFTRAADALDVQKSHVSRVIAQLEAQLGVQLLERTTRALSVTEVGREIYERAIGILSAVDDTARIAQITRTEPSGRLRLTCGADFGLFVVGAWIDEYLATHAKVSADIEYTSRVIDLVHEGFDLAIRIGTLRESRLCARRLGEIEYGLFASPDYVQAAGRPKSPQALARHRLVMFSGGAQRRGWQLQRHGDEAREATAIQGPAALRVDAMFGVRDALLRGVGIGLLPLLAGADDVAARRLLPILPQWQAAPVAVHAVYPSNRYLSPKVRAFVDLAAMRFPEAALRARRLASSGK
jgi:DNA-binding transcriptional LysR family regulator